MWKEWDTQLSAPIHSRNIYPGWWFQPSEKYEFVSWDDEIPNIYGKIEFMFQPTNQYHKPR